MTSAGAALVRTITSFSITYVPYLLVRYLIIVTCIKIGFGFYDGKNDWN